MGWTYKREDAEKARAVGFRDAQRSFDFEYPWLTEPLTKQEIDIDLPPSLSCKGGLTKGQRQGFILILMLLGLSGLSQPELLLSGLSGVFWVLFSLLVLWRAALLAGGLALATKKTSDLAAYDLDLPIYTVMIAAYKEADVMPQLAQALRKLDWPDDRLDIMLLLEEDDSETLPAALHARFPKGTRIITVPNGLPKTKPRALNFGLARAKGEFICIFDVEDRPHPSQLKAAYAKFCHSGPELVCIQAPLIGANANRGWLAAHWSLEYAVQFRFLLPALAAIQAPIPIGGTSNHFRRTSLIDAGGWDAFNVTEDADLGLRFSRLGWQVQAINLGTLEDAPTTLRDWKAQRSRWIKGFIQTWLVLMRRPSLTLKQLGWRNFIMLQLTLGGAILAPVAHGPLFIVLLASVLVDQLSPGAAGWALLITGWLVTLSGDLAAPGVPLRGRLLGALTRIFYWPLHSIAAAMALYEMVTRPHYWAKTPHTPSMDTDAACSTGLLP
ncbi:MAG: glycosyltransferase family 2 protein [Pseudomonadota bacterium]